MGYRYGEELARCLSSADVFVFPSRTDTFGLVMLEAMACGTPVAAFPVTGPIDVVTAGVNGVLAEDLATAARAALTLDRDGCRRSALTRTWARASGEFFGHLVAARGGRDLAAAGAGSTASIAHSPSNTPSQSLENGAHRRSVAVETRITTPF